MWGELSWREFSLGRVVLGRVVFGASCPDPPKRPEIVPIPIFYPSILTFLEEEQTNNSIFHQNNDHYDCSLVVSKILNKVCIYA